ncbi:MAG TPA: amino acid permease [Candidatus Acidoferrales bacterium]
MSAEPAALRRAIGLPHATALVAGTILGASIFVQPSEISLHVPSVTGMMAVWLLAGLLTLCGALVCAELAAAYPHTGGVYVFLRELFSPAMGFLWGWAMLWSVHSGIIAAMSVILARYVGYFFPLDDAGTRAVAIAAIVMLSVLNYTGVRTSSTAQLVLTIAKLAAVALILVLFLAMGGGGETERATPPVVAAAPAPVGLREFALALTAGLFSYGGWHMVTYSAGETHDAARNIPRALMGGTLLVTVCYLALNAAYLHVLPLEEMTRSVRVAADAAERVVGPAGGSFISALVILSTLGALIGIVLAGPRVYYAMARDGIVFRWLGDVHARFQTPHRAIVAQAVVASALVATDTYRNLFTRVIYTEWIFFALLAWGVMRLRRRAGFASILPRWTYPAVPLLFIASSLLIVVNQVLATPREAAYGLLLVLAGLPVYYLWTRNRQGAAQ